MKKVNRDKDKAIVINLLKKGMQPWEIQKQLPVIPLYWIKTLRIEYVNSLTEEKQKELELIIQKREEHNKNEQPIRVEEITQLILYGYAKWEIQKKFPNLSSYTINKICKEFLLTRTQEEKEEIKTKAKTRRKINQNGMLLELINTNLSCDEILPYFQEKKITKKTLMKKIQELYFLGIIPDDFRCIKEMQQYFSVEVPDNSPSTSIPIEKGR